ncbi:hypothetical protein FNJ84_16130 [Paracoccus sp. M683]|uniref:hypothetical protein n=1 Tax=Paracoccus sp. M683 TaxID=2594268 RepID=UPI00117C63A7|nr:hypothetical protein [Paracoccus sp. M683]TRW95506.1 hypothetical protein FNJ84_16130 [Paracoccus sp. M683]
MVTIRNKMAQLARLAQLKSDLELKRFAAFSTNVEAARQRIEACEEAVARCYASAAPMTLAEARVASAQAGEMSRNAERGRRELQMMLPRFELARQRAAKEFGRANVLESLSGQWDRK